MTEELTREQRLDIEVERWKQMDLDARIEDLVQWIKQGYPEVARARINALTRKCTMSDADLWGPINDLFASAKFHAAMPPGVSHNWEPMACALRDLLKELRDRYEELGKYAPGQEVP